MDEPGSGCVHALGDHGRSDSLPHDVPQGSRGETHDSIRVALRVLGHHVLEPTDQDDQAEAEDDSSHVEPKDEAKLI